MVANTQINTYKMKLKYNIKRGKRINHRFIGITTFENDWKFDRNINKWTKTPEVGEKGYGRHQRCRSVKAFRRKLKTAPKGVKFILVSRWVGYEVDGVGSFPCE